MCDIRLQNGAKECLHVFMKIVTTNDEILEIKTEIQRTTEKKESRWTAPKKTQRKKFLHDGQRTDKSTILLLRFFIIFTGSQCVRSCVIVNHFNFCIVIPKLWHSQSSSCTPKFIFVVAIWNVILCVCIHRVCANSDFTGHFSIFLRNKKKIISIYKTIGCFCLHFCPQLHSHTRSNSFFKAWKCKILVLVTFQAIAKKILLFFGGCLSIQHQFHCTHCSTKMKIFGECYCSGFWN